MNGPSLRYLFSFQNIYWDRKKCIRSQMLCPVTTALGNTGLDQNFGYNIVKNTGLIVLTKPSSVNPEARSMVYNSVTVVIFYVVVLNSNQNSLTVVLSSELNPWSFLYLHYLFLFVTEKIYNCPIISLNHSYWMGSYSRQ